MRFIQIYLAFLSTLWNTRKVCIHLHRDSSAHRKLLGHSFRRCFCFDRDKVGKLLNFPPSLTKQKAR